MKEQFLSVSKKKPLPQISKCAIYIAHVNATLYMFILHAHINDLPDIFVNLNMQWMNCTLENIQPLSCDFCSALALGETFLLVVPCGAPSKDNLPFQFISGWYVTDCQLCDTYVGCTAYVIIIFITIGFDVFVDETHVLIFKISLSESRTRSICLF